MDAGSEWFSPRMPKSHLRVSEELCPVYMGVFHNWLAQSICLFFPVYSETNGRKSTIFLQNIHTLIVHKCMVTIFISFAMLGNDSRITGFWKNKPRNNFINKTTKFEIFVLKIRVRKYFSFITFISKQFATGIKKVFLKFLNFEFLCPQA